MSETYTNAPPRGLPERAILPAIRNGARRRCPACGNGRLFGRYIDVEPQCASCGEELHHHRADDAPPYFTMLIVGHIIIGAMLFVEQSFAPEAWVHTAIWIPLTLALSLWLLPRVKGALIGLQWALRMHGFGGPETAEQDHAEHH